MSTKLLPVLLGILLLSSTGCGGPEEEPESLPEVAPPPIVLGYTRYNFSWDGRDRSFVYKIFATNPTSGGGMVACRLRVDGRRVEVEVLPDRITSDREVFVFVDGTLPEDVPQKELDNTEPDCYVTPGVSRPPSSETPEG